MFKELTIENWKQFDKVRIPFHERVTVITGANGSGKTTLIRFLARNIGWNYNEVATPRKHEKTGVFRFFTRLLKKGWIGDFENTEEELGTEIGILTYSNGQHSQIVLPSNTGPTYYPSVNNPQSVKGLHIPAHRPQFLYSPVQQIATNPRSKQEAFNHSLSHTMSMATDGGANRSSYIIKETLISWATLGYGNEAIEADFRSREAYENFQEVLKKILPETLGFERLAIRKSEVVLICRSGDFLLDACSGGISALVDLAWQVFTFPVQENERFVVIIDEAENHLHASMQRSLLPTFMQAFPNVQFVVTTHSPMIVGSVKESNVVALKYGSEGRVYSELLDLVNKASTASDLLRDVLGVPLTIPIWAEKEIESLIQKFSTTELSEENLNAFCKDLETQHLAHLVPTGLNALVKRKRGN